MSETLGGLAGLGDHSLTEEQHKHAALMLDKLRIEIGKLRLFTQTIYDSFPMSQILCLNFHSNEFNKGISIDYNFLPEIKRCMYTVDISESLSVQFFHGFQVIEFLKEVFNSKTLKRLKSEKETEKLISKIYPKILAMKEAPAT